MSEILRDALNDLSEKQVDILNHSLKMMSKSPNFGEYVNIVSSNLDSLLDSISILSRAKISVVGIRNRLLTTLSLLRELEDYGKFSDETKLHTAIAVLTTYLKDIKNSGYEFKIPKKEDIMENTENLTVFGDRTTKNVFQLRPIRGESSRKDWGVFQINEGQIVKVNEFYTRQKAIDWIEHELGFRERLDELVNKNVGLFRDEVKEKDENLHRRSGRDDAELYVLSGRKNERQTEDITSLLTKSISEMISEKKLMTDAQLKAIIENKKSNEEITDLTKELLSKTDEEIDDLEKILSNIATGIIINKKKRDRFES